MYTYDEPKKIGHNFRKLSVVKYRNLKQRQNPIPLTIFERK